MITTHLRQDRTERVQRRNLDGAGRDGSVGSIAFFLDRCTIVNDISSFTIIGASDHHSVAFDIHL